MLRQCRDWAAEVGEIKVTDDANPVISIQVTGVDIEPIVRGAEAHDNPGNRRRKIREMLFEQLGVSDTSELFAIYPYLWRGTRREVELIVRERPRALGRPPEGARGKLDGRDRFSVRRPQPDTGGRPRAAHELPGRRHRNPGLGALLSERQDAARPRPPRGAGLHPDRRALQRLRRAPLAGRSRTRAGARQEPARPAPAASQAMPGGRLRHRERAARCAGLSARARGPVPVARPDAQSTAAGGCQSQGRLRGACSISSSATSSRRIPSSIRRSERRP